MRKFQKARLLKLADLLEADAKAKRGIQFNLCTVVTREDATAGASVPMDCGTQACAMGLAALSGAFKRSAGLSYKVKPDVDGLVEIVTTIKGRPRTFDRAAMVTFGIAEDEADFLFTPAAYYGSDELKGAGAEREVAKRIRAFVKDRSIAE